MKEYVATSSSDFLSFYKKPTLPEIYYEKHKTQNNCEMGKIKFLSEVENGYSNRDAIFYYKKNLVVDNNVNVIFVHGWRAENLDRLTRYKYNCGHSGIVLSKNKIKKDVMKFIEERI